MNERRQNFIAAALSIAFSLISVILAFTAGYLVRDRQAPAGDLRVLRQAHELILLKGYNPPPDGSALEYGMVRGMIQAYNDPYTSFSEPAQHELNTQNLQGRFGGIGVSLNRDAQNRPVLLPIRGGPAEQAGIQEGDILTAIDDLAITPETPQDTILAAARGPVDSEVRIQVLRPSTQAALEFRLRRQEFNLPSVSWYLAPDEPRLGVIKVHLIADPTPDEIQQGVQELQARGATHFALDLRDNFGGLLQSGIETSRLFLQDGIVIQEQYKGQEIKSYPVERPGPLVDLPLLVFINQNTASAAEIIAGALQGNQRARLIGLPSYGKDTIQLVYELVDGSSLNLTSAHWWVPSLSQPLAGHGLQPDFPITVGQDGGDSWIQTAIQLFFEN